MNSRSVAAAFIACCVAAAATSPAAAVTSGEVVRDPNGLRRSVVEIDSSAGELCSGALIAPDLVLTAAHCVLERAAYRVVLTDRRFRRVAVKAVAAALHPAFVAGTTPREQPGVDLAIIKLAEPIGGDFVPLDPSNATAFGEGEAVNLAGYGLASERQRGSARVLRSTTLVSLGTLQGRNRVVVVADGQRLAQTAGAGACRGDSGGPILRGSPETGYQLLGIVSWSSGALRSREATACGGLTAVTPVSEHGGPEREIARTRNHRCGRQVLCPGRGATSSSAHVHHHPSVGPCPAPNAAGRTRTSDPPTG